jgi:putative toxin-antitoxin system antitoxin component (TIGR02293 family)
MLTASLLAFTAILPCINAMPTAFEVAEMPMKRAVAVIRAGLPARAFVGVAEILSLTVDELAGKLGVSPRTIRDQRKKLSRLSSENTEKLVRVARIHRQAGKIFSTNEAISGWLRSPAPALEGARPIDLVDTDFGAREVENVLNGIAYGNVM